MRIKILLIATISCVLLQSCQKKVATATEKFDVNYKVPISNKIKEPSIISGFFGTVTKTNKKKGTTDPSKTAVLIYPFDLKEQIEAVKYEENGVTFYNLKALASQGVLPKYKFIPNKSGFYQMDLGEEQFCILLEVGNKKGYYPGGLGVLSASMSVLMQLDLSADY